MIFFETLKNSIGGLLRLKTQLYWYGGRGWDNNPGRICLILDAYDGRHTNTTAEAYLPATTARGAAATVLLLIDGSPKWVWIDEQNTEIMNE